MLDMSCCPVWTACAPMARSAPTPATLRAPNALFRTPVLFDRPSISTWLAALVIPSSPFDALSSLRDSSSFFKIPRVAETAPWNLELSKVIDTTFWSMLANSSHLFPNFFGNLLKYRTHRWVDVIPASDIASGTSPVAVLEDNRNRHTLVDV